MFGLLVSVFVSIWNPGTSYASDTTSIISDSTRRVVVQQVHIVGNKRTNEEIILREMELRQGTSIQYDRIEILKKSDRERIYNTRLFNSVDISVVDSSPYAVDVFVILSERWYTFPAPILELVDRNFNDWWVNENHDLSRINYGIKLYQLNMRGRNETLKLTAQFGFTKKFALSYEIPYIDKNQRNGIEMGFSYTENNNISIRTVGHKRDFFGAEESILTQTNVNMIYRMRPSFYDYHYFEISFRNATIGDTVVVMNDQYFGKGLSEQRMLSFAYGFRKDRRDIIAYPLTGYKFDISMRKNGLGIFNDVNFITFLTSYSRYSDLGKGYYLSNHSAVYANTTNNISYNNYYGLGYNNHYVRGYELYLVEGPLFLLNKFSVKKLIFSREAHLSMSPLEQFRKLPIQIYLKTYLDMGYVDNYNNYDVNSLLSNRFLYGSGIGLDFVTWYDVVFRTEFSINHLKETGFFFHLRKEF